MLTALVMMAKRNIMQIERDNCISKLNLQFFPRRKYLLDGLISAATSDAIAVMRDEVVTGTVKPEVVNRWITSLAFIPR